MKLMDDQAIKQKSSDGTTVQTDRPSGSNGFPLNHPKCDISAQQRTASSEIDGGRFDLVGAYGVWLDSRSRASTSRSSCRRSHRLRHGSASARRTAASATCCSYGKFKRQLAEHCGRRDRRSRSARRRARRASSSVPVTPDSIRSSPPATSRVRLRSAGTSASSSTSTIAAGCLQLERGGHRARQRRCSRCAVRSNGRLFKDDSETFNDIAVWPGLDFNLTDNIIIRPQGLAPPDDRTRSIGASASPSCSRCDRAATRHGRQISAGGVRTR